MKKTMLCTAPLGFVPELRRRIGGSYILVDRITTDMEETRQVLLASNPDAWIVNPCPKFVVSADLVQSAANLKVIVTPSTGTNHIDLKSFENTEIAILSLRDSSVLSTIVASSEFTFALLLSVARKIPQACRVVENGGWRDQESELRAVEMAGKSIGIIGYGRIGSNVARYASAMGMIVSAYDPYVKIDDSNVGQANSLNDLVMDKDFLIVSVHLNDHTYGMINKKLITKMKNDVVLVNTSRGDIVIETDIVEAIQSGVIGAYGTDVLSLENSQRDLKLNKVWQLSRTHSNVVITPHIAGLTYDSEIKAQTAAFELADNYLAKLQVL